MNNFTHLSESEFSDMFIDPHTGVLPIMNRTNLRDMYSFQPWNWDRDRKCITKVFDQRFCKASYGFSSSDLAASISCIRHGGLVELSKQQHVDCTKYLGNKGCNGGSIASSLKYLNLKGGVQEREYPYQGNESIICKDKWIPKPIIVANILLMGQQKENIDAGLMNGPLASTVSIDHKGFRFYHRGIYSHDECNSEKTKPGQSILLIGMYSEPDNQESHSYIVKNSWGTEWGENGYMRIKRVDDNSDCGIKKNAFSVTVK